MTVPRLYLALMAMSACATAQADDFVVNAKTDDLLAFYCYDCHDDATQKGDLRLDNIGELTQEERLDLFNRMQEQVYLKQMPPKKEDQPTDVERESLVKWLSADLRKHNAASFEAKLLKPKYGNYVDHNKLFSGEITAKPFSPARRWIVSPYIFKNRINRIYLSKRYDKMPGGVVNPFHLPEESGVRYYDGELVGGGHFLTMVANAKVISYAQLGILSQEDIMANEERAKQLKIELDKVNKSDLKEKGIGGSKASSRKRLESQYAAKKVTQIPYGKKGKQSGAKEFDAIVHKKSAPSEAEIETAINFQFSIVHQRTPTTTELASLKKLTTEAIAKVGNTEGLRSMLVAVLLQPELMYRSEFGEGEADEHGRKKLSPREASYAIAYALTERDPDEALISAAKSGKLNTKEDYRAQILRLLKPKSTREKIDPRLHTRSSSSHNTAQLIKLRFFREFFGYSKAFQVFKDNKRFEGGRQDSAIKLMINDADLMVEKILESDTDVFNQLLTTEEFYLYHNGDNKSTLAAVEEMKQTLKELLAKDWKKDPKAFHKKNSKQLVQFIGKGKYDKKFLAKMKDLKSNKNRVPPIYPKGNSFRSGGDRSVNRTNMFNIDHLTWDYPAKQPFKISHRKGMLTHPAWLTAFSLNVSTDPVRRGLWIREKLLAGFVPDVPITVDAAIPEDHHKTLRQRVEMKTEAKGCYKCHQAMNPLGYPFEMYDDFGRFRTEEELEYPEHLITEAPNKGNYTRNKYKTLPLDTSGYLKGTGDPNLDGEVNDAIDMITRLAKSERVRQSIIRHAFRYFMGRNELLSDSQTLIDADQAYLKSNGSFNAVIVSLLTSDSFMYRKERKDSK